MENLTEQLNKVDNRLQELLADVQSEDSLYFAQQYYELYKELNLLRQYVRDADFREAHRPKQDTKVNDVRVIEPVKANLTEKDLLEQPKERKQFYNGRGGTEEQQAEYRKKISDAAKAVINARELIWNNDIPLTTLISLHYSKPKPYGGQ